MRAFVLTDPSGWTGRIGAVGAVTLVAGVLSYAVDRREQGRGLALRDPSEEQPGT